MKYTAIVLAFLIAGCDDSPRSQPTTATTPPPQAAQRNPQPTSPVQPPAEPARKSPDGDVTIIVEVTELPDGRVRLHGTTNLPAATNLMLSVEERAQGGFMGQSKCAVAGDGSFNSEAFGPQSGLKDGAYIAGVVMPIARVQPESVKQVIGKNGENLSGALVENGSFGVTVSARKEFTIGGEQAAQAQEQRLKERIQQYRDWEKKVSALHSRLQAARRSSDPASDPGNWGKFAREFHADIQSHQDQLMQVQPVSARFVIGDPLDAVRRMFHATAFEKPEDYDEASADFSKSLNELRKFIRENETASILRADVSPKSTRIPESKSYEIVSTKNLDFVSPETGERVHRRVYRVQLKRKHSRSELEEVSAELIAQARFVDAMSMFFYLPDSEPTGAYTAGRAIWAPNGKWMNAGQSGAKELAIEYGGVLPELPKDREVDLPVSEKRDIFMTLVRYEDAGMDTRQSRAATAKKYGMTEEEVENIGLEGMCKNWPMPPMP